ERTEDIPLLIEHFLAKYASREKRSEAGIAPDVADALKRHPWPGNVRELENTVQRALALSKDGFITPSDLPKEIQRTIDPGGEASAPGLVDDRPTLAELERRY